MISSRRNLCAAAALGAVAAAFALCRTVHATGVPVGGFLPLVGIGLTDEYKDGEEFDFFAETATSVGGSMLGSGGQPYFDVAILDTGANGSLLTTAAHVGFDIDGHEFDGTEIVTIGGATGTMDTVVSDPLGVYATGLAHRTATAPLGLNTGSLVGQTNVSLLTMPPESDLPNVLGLPFASQFTTRIRNDQPQIFQLNGETVRTPQVEFHPLGSGGMGITRRAQLSLQPSSAFIQPPLYVFNLANIINGAPVHEDPTGHTHLNDGTTSRAALFMSVDVQNAGESLDNTNFFFDTGADVTVVSELNASRLGFDVELDEPEFTVAVVGSGGAKLNVPGFFVDTFTIEAVGGNVTATNVPVVVLNVTNPADPGNFVPGILGTNLLAGRNIVIDPDPSLGGSNQGPHIYISDPVTGNSNWTSAAASATWAVGSNWSSVTAPGVLNIANVRHVSGGNQEAVVAANATAWEVNVSGASPAQQMTLRVQNGATVTTFSGMNIEQHGAVALQGGALDVHYIDIRGGRLSGHGSIATGSGQIPGQVENISGIVAPGTGVGVLNIEGRYSNGAAGTLQIEIGGMTAGTQYDRLLVDGPTTLDGILAVSLVNLGGGTFVPNLGNVFSIITAEEVGGAFSGLNLPTLTANKMWAVVYEPTEVRLAVTIPGDFNGDFTVDGADLDTWSDGFGTLFSGASFLDWQRNLGMSVPLIAAVPEPTALALLTLGAVGIVLRRRAGGLLAHG